MSRRPSPLDNKPCRQCHSFSDYLKETKKQILEDGEARDNESELMCMPEEDPSLTKPRRTDCPLDKDELGNKTWGFLHTMAAKFSSNPSCEEQNDMKQFFSLLAQFYPCDHCAADLREELKTNPPRVKNQEILSRWLCLLHNKINVKTGKPEFDCNRVEERWRDGWLDGSCD